MRSHILNSGLGSARRRVTRTAMLAVVLVGASAMPARAHDKGTLRLASRTFAAGDSIPVTGAKFSPRDEVTLVLVGASGRHALVDVRTDSVGAFRRVVLVPSTLTSGRYRLIAEALDGDEAAALDVVVEANVPGGAPPPHKPINHAMPGMEHGEMSMPMPTAAPVSLARARSASVTSAAVLLILACFAAGTALLRSSRHQQRESH